MVLDTGATLTSIHVRTARSLRLVTDASRHVGVTTASGRTTAEVFIAPIISGIGLTRDRFPILGQVFPESFTADGLLGLDFVRDHVLTVDFIKGLVRLRPPRPWWRFWK
jgi:predicted aspartyl protease